MCPSLAYKTSPASRAESRLRRPISFSVAPPLGVESRSRLTAPRLAYWGDCLVAYAPRRAARAHVDQEKDALIVTNPTPTDPGRA